MNNQSFNLYLLNFVIGLFKNHRFYRPISTSIHELGYNLFAVELTFKIGGHERTPEILLCSEQQGHTILLESTMMDGVNTKKRTQIQRSLKATTQDLVDSAFVTVPAAQTNSTWMIVIPKAVIEYSQILTWESDSGIALSSFSGADDTGYVLNPEGGTFIDSNLSDLLSSPISTERIYRGYVRIDTSCLDARSIAAPVMMQLVAFLVQRRHQFTAEEVASQLFRVWPSYSVQMRTAITKSVQSVIKDFSRKSYTAELITQVAVSQNEWHILVEEAKFMLFQTRFNKAALRYQTEITSGKYQLDLPLEF